MKIREPLPHWTNFTIPQLRDILEHCVALEKLGIAQDEEMMVSIERDITLREKKTDFQHEQHKLTPYRIVQKPSSATRKAELRQKQQPQKFLLEQTA